MTSNTVDVSPERIAAEFASVRAEALKIHPPVDTTSPDNVTGQPDHVSQVKMGAGGFEIPDLPTGDLCCFVGGVAASVYAPNWVANGLGDAQIESVGRPLGAVIDKYLDKYFPGQDIGALIEPWKEEIALAYAAATLYATFSHVPRKAEPKAMPQPERERVKQPDIHTDFNLDQGDDAE